LNQLLIAKRKMLLGLWVLFEVELLQEKQETGPSSLFPTRGAVAVDQHY
jgi:hypothetical protein